MVRYNRRRVRPRRVARRMARRKPMMRFRRKKVMNHVHRFIRWADATALYPTIDKGPNAIYQTAVDQHFSYSFNLRNVLQEVDFTSLYDMYRINKVTLYLERARTVTGSGNDNPFNFRIAVVHDYNDNNTLTSEDDYLEYSNCKRYSTVGNGPIKIVLYPKIANKIENVDGGTAFTAMNANKVWVNTVNDRVPHFGIKIFVPAGVVTNDYALFKVRAKFDCSFKNSK